MLVLNEARAMKIRNYDELNWAIKFVWMTKSFRD
jgi:hypothetical protein